MAGFSGFVEVGRRFQASQRERMVNLAVQVEIYEFLVKKEFVLGRDLASGSPVRATLAERRGQEGRLSLSDLREANGDGGTLVLLDCIGNRMGTFEGRKAVPFTAPRLVLTDGVASVGMPRQRDDGRWGQAIQHVRTDAAVRCTTYRDLLGLATCALDEAGPGRAGAVIRGCHPASRKGGVMCFEIAQAWNAADQSFCASGASFDAFAADPNIFVSGINASTTGNQCLDEVARLMDSHSGDIIWEVIPKRSFSLSGQAAEEAGLGVRRDLSAPYRMASGRSTGFVASVLGFAEKDDAWWPRIAVPQRMDVPPVAVAYVATAHSAPSVPLARPYRLERPGRDAITAGSGAPPPDTLDDTAPPLPPDLDEIDTSGVTFHASR